jgi:glutaconate CoA-transferase, subunit B
MSYTAQEMMLVAAAREIAGNGVVFMGMSHPILAGSLAKRLHDPNIIFCTEGGVVDWEIPEDIQRAPIQVTDPIMYRGAAFCGDMTESLAAGVQGQKLYKLACLPIGQMDQFGNGNTVVVGSYNSPVQRIGGIGGNMDVACCAPAIMWVVPHEKRRFLPRVDFITSPGYIDGPGARDRAGLYPQGPNVVVTTLGILRFDTPDGGLTGTCEAYLDAVFPGVTVEEVQAQTGWPLRLAPEVKVIEPPTEEELATLHALDPLGAYLKGGVD